MYLEGLPTTGKMRVNLHRRFARQCLPTPPSGAGGTGPAGYDVLGVNSEDYRLAPRLNGL